MKFLKYLWITVSVVGISFYGSQFLYDHVLFSPCQQLERYCAAPTVLQLDRVVQCAGVQVGMFGQKRTNRRCKNVLKRIHAQNSQQR